LPCESDDNTHSVVRTAAAFPCSGPSSRKQIRLQVLAEDWTMKIRTQVAIALIVPSIVVIAAGLNYSGMCVRKWSYPTDALVLEAALRREAPSMEELSDTSSHEELEQYLATHPNCCVVLGYVRYGDEMFIDYITGFRKKWVRILYKSRSKTEPRYRDAHVAVLPCGEAVHGAATMISEGQMNARLLEMGTQKKETVR
jgi:hypothetical protein